MESYIMFKASHKPPLTFLNYDIIKIIYNKPFLSPQKYAGKYSNHVKNSNTTIEPNNTKPDQNASGCLRPETQEAVYSQRAGKTHNCALHNSELDFSYSPIQSIKKVSRCGKLKNSNAISCCVLYTPWGKV